MGWMVGDRPKGIQTCEKMLLNGTTLTAIGEIVISKDTLTGAAQREPNSIIFGIVQT